MTDKARKTLPVECSLILTRKLKLQLSRTCLCKLLISNCMVSREIWINMHSIVSFSKTSNSTRPSDSCYFEVFEKLTRACYIQIALETIPLPILNVYNKICGI
jgi:hypothetical protein